MIQFSRTFERVNMKPNQLELSQMQSALQEIVEGILANLDKGQSVSSTDAGTVIIIYIFADMCSFSFILGAIISAILLLILLSLKLWKYFGGRNG